MKKRSLIISVTVILLTGVGAYFYFKTKKSEISIQTGKVEKGDIQIAVTATGQINPVIQVAVGTQVSGIISKIFVDFNSHVKKGQVIAELDKTALRASLEDARAGVDRAKFQADQAKRDFDRQKLLYDEKIIARSEYEASQTNYKALMSTLNSMQSQYNRALVNLNYTTIIAPINGVVVSRSVDVGQTVAASFNTPTLFNIANDLTKMQVSASVDEADIGNVKLGQKVDFTVDAYPSETFAGIVTQIRLQPTITQNVVTYSVIIEVNNSEQKLLPGMTANINIIIEKHTSILKVPTSALRFSPDPELMKDFMMKLPDSIKKKFQDRKDNKEKFKRGSQKSKSLSPGSKGRVWVKKGETMFPVKVIIGLSDGSLTEVTGNLKEEDEIIVNVTKVEKESSSTQQNPFAPKMPSRGGSGSGGGGGRNR